MGWHLTERLAWHGDGWSGHVCTEPQKNTCCVGAHSFPGDMIAERRNLTWEQSCAGLDKAPSCIYSINAFGREPLLALSVDD